ncbi:MAG: hypothetical protein ABIJ12_15180 [bacterium]
MRKLLSLLGIMVLLLALFSSCSDTKGTDPVQSTVPTLSTLIVSAVTETTAECGGTITSDGGAAVTARGVCWSTDVTPTTADNITTYVIGTGSFTSSLTGLTAGTSYYVRAYATNSAGTGYGSTQSFNTTALSPQVLQSTFDTDYDDWSVSGGGIYYHGTDGNPGGFVEFEDFEDLCGYFLAPSKFLGDLSIYDQGTLSFDLKNTVNNGQTMLGCYGMIRISSGTLYAEKNVVPYNTYLSDWTSFSIPLTAEEWSVTEEQWDSIIVNVTDIIIYMDTQMNYYDHTGLDNFCITSTTPKVRSNSCDRLQTDSNSSPQ